MTDAELDLLLDGLVPAVKTHVAETLAPIADRLVTIEKRLETLESARPSMKYCGVWLEAKPYDLGDIVTRGGSMWHSNVNHNRAQPGTPGDSWTMCVKAGRDGKDAR